MRVLAPKAQIESGIGQTAEMKVARGGLEEPISNFTHLAPPTTRMLERPK